jgi:hypothetical protein
LALFRIAIGLIIAIDALCWTLRANLFLTDSGLMPRSLVFGWPRSIYLANGSLWFAELVLVCAIAFALLFAAGWRTKWTGLASFLLLFSLHVRSPYTINSGDPYLRLILLWSLFLPIGERWSLDAMRKRLRETPVSHGVTLPAVAWFLFVAQVVVLHWVAVLHKLQQESWIEGDAVYFALTPQHMQGVLAGPWFEPLLAAFSPVGGWGVMSAQLLGTACILFANERIRLAGIVVLASLQIGFFAFLDVGIFPWAVCASFIPFITGRALDIVGAGVARCTRRWRCHAADWAPATQTVKCSTRPVWLNLALLVPAFVMAYEATAGVSTFRLPRYGLYWQAVSACGITQDWRMFSRPLMSSFRIAVAARFVRGGNAPQKVDLVSTWFSHATDPRGGFEIKRDLFGGLRYYGDFRFRKHAETVIKSARDTRRSGKGRIALYFCQFFSREYDWLTAGNWELILVYADTPPRDSVGQRARKPIQQGLLNSAWKYVPAKKKPDPDGTLKSEDEKKVEAPTMDDDAKVEPKRDAPEPTNSGL